MKFGEEHPRCLQYVVLKMLRQTSEAGGGQRCASLSARKELANELNLHVGADGSAEENTALHKAVMAKLAENGGKVPADLRG